MVCAQRPGRRQLARASRGPTRAAAAGWCRFVRDRSLAQEPAL